MAAYIKAVLAIVISFVGAIAAVLVGDESLSSLDVSDWLVIALATLGSGGLVYLVSKAAAAKAIVGALTASLTALSAAVASDQIITSSEWIAALLAGFVSLGAVYRIPNADEQPPSP
jgi:hypothetical protein